MREPELLFLHALPLDGSMWRAQMDLLPGGTHAPTLYGFGESIGNWAAAALRPLRGDRIVVVGCSVGGSCALEVAALAPERVAALVLIGTKAGHRPDPALRDDALATIRDRGMEAAWSRYWEPLFCRSTDRRTVEEARRIALRQSPDALSAGIRVFHSRPSRDGLLATFVKPVFVVSGADDPAPGIGTGKAQAALAPDGQFHDVPECGHYVPMEKPAVLNAILRRAIAAA